MRRCACWLVLGLSLLVVAGGCAQGDAQDGERDADAQAADGTLAESLFGDDATSDGYQQPDAPDLGLDAVAPDTLADSASDPGDLDQTPPDGAKEAETLAPIDWDVLVLTAQKGQVHKNGAYYSTIQTITASSFVALDGLQTRYFSLTVDGQGRVDGDSLFTATGVPAGVTFLDLAAVLGADGTDVFTLQTNGQIRNNGGQMLNVTAPAGEAFVAIAAAASTELGVDDADFYLATDLGTIYKKNVLFPGVKVPATAADPLVAMRVRNSQFYSVTQSGKVYKNSALVLGLAGQAAPPFVAIDVTPEHTYTLTRSCVVFEDATELYTVKPFTGDTCQGLALVHSLD